MKSMLLEVTTALIVGVIAWFVGKIYEKRQKKKHWDERIEVLKELHEAQSKCHGLAS